MSLHDVLILLAGGALVALGVFAGGVADRIRHPRAPSPANARSARTRDKRAGGEGGEFQASKAAGAHVIQGTKAQEIAYNPERVNCAPQTSATEKMAADVARALVTAGYDKQTAQIAVAACAGSERATLEAWTRAALRRAMKQGAVS